MFDSGQYETYCPELVFFILSFEYLGDNETKFDNILTDWSVAQASSNNAKTTGRGRKSRWIVPLYTETDCTQCTVVILLKQCLYLRT